MPLRAVTLDAYGTLFDLDAVMMPAVTELIADQSLDILPQALSDGWTTRFFALLHSYGDRTPPGFQSIRDMTATSLDECFAALGAAGADVPRGVEIWFDHVRRAPVFPEVRRAVEMLASKFRLALISDADDDVIGPTWRDARLPVEHVFTSQTERSYKIDAGSAIFQKAFAALGVAPEETAHVGDSSADVIGARRAGAHAVWLSRDGRDWTDERAEPTHTARDMAEAAQILCGE
jgi:HAD superfamily hydrolase (TIGR01549 family)